MSSTIVVPIYEMSSLNLEGALEIQNHILGLAPLKGVAICVVDALGNQLCAVTMNGARPASTQTAHAKAVTAVRFQRDTVEFRFKLDDPGEWIPAGKDGWSDHDVANAMKINPIFCTWAGGTLVKNPANGFIIGAVGVSNLSEIEDHMLSARRPSHWSE